MPGPFYRREPMDFSIPRELSEDLERFKLFLKENLLTHLKSWYQDGALPRSFHRTMAKEGWLSFEIREGRPVKRSGLRWALLMEHLASLSPGVAVAVLAQVDLGITGLWLFGTEGLKTKYGASMVAGETLICVGNTEAGAGSDVANINMEARKVKAGWVLNGTKAYATNGLISDLAVITAVSDPGAPRSNRISMFLVDLSSEGVLRRKLNKHVWIPSDLTRLQFTNVFVPEDHLMGERGRGLQQVLTIFTHSRVPISALTLGTAVGAFELALDHGGKREIFGQKIIDFQAKAFEIADFYARIEAARLMLWKACWNMDQGESFRMESSLAKYLAVLIARDVTAWAADLFGAASVVFEHPIHKFPMDAWASSLGEGTQDVQKLIIFRELMKERGGPRP
jgi:alkylation response protein AidB-like acyl-CoA dehydrogenase